MKIYKFILETVLHFYYTIPEPIICSFWSKQLFYPCNDVKEHDNLDVINLDERKSNVWNTTLNIILYRM